MSPYYISLRSLFLSIFSANSQTHSNCIANKHENGEKVAAKKKEEATAATESERGEEKKERNNRRSWKCNVLVHINIVFHWRAAYTYSICIKISKCSRAFYDFQLHNQFWRRFSHASCFYFFFFLISVQFLSLFQLLKDIACLGRVVFISISVFAALFFASSFGFC